MKETKCKFCGREFKAPSGRGIHERVCKLNPNRRPLENNGNGWTRGRKRKEGGWKCSICGAVLERRIDLHEHSVEVHDKKPVKWKIIDGKRKMVSGHAWNKGLDKKTDRRILESGIKLHKRYKNGELIPSNKGRIKPEEEKRKISESRKKYLKEHPDKVPYLLNHHRKGPSYPERYFMRVFHSRGMNFEMDYSQCGYFLDFAWPEQKLYFEVDGEQHYQDKRIVKHDKMRTAKLSDNGWMLVDRVRWSKYQKLTREERESYIEKLTSMIRFKQVSNTAH